MRTLFVPKNFNLPIEKILGEYKLVLITTDETKEDWDILIKNADMIVKQRGGGSRKDWPYSCTLEEDYKDLAWLELCALYRQLFCYIIRDKKTNIYLGAVYIYPIELFFSEKADKYDVDLSFWIVESEFNKGKYKHVAEQLTSWLKKDWPFKKERIYFRNQLKVS